MRTTEKTIPYKEGWNANLKGHQRLSGHQYALGTSERAEWLQGYDDAQKQWDEGKEDPRFMDITYPNNLKKEGWKKLKYS